ncbi:MAG: alpha/beta hydrolase [Xanthomonadales bacterium]|nr:alpha/beta hydrolase [Xanthomonadales bacterium]
MQLNGLAGHRACVMCILLILLGCQFGSVVFAAEAAVPTQSDELKALAAAYRGPTADADQLTFVTVNGVRLAYRLEGAGIPVVFVHGEGYSHELWTEQVDAFSKDHLFISYDRRGHGSSEDPITGYSETAHANDLNALLLHLGIRNAHFVVNSRGGSIIIQFLKMYGDKVRSITFADATIPLVAISEQSAFYKVVPYLFGPPPGLEQAAKGREGATKSSFTRVAQSRPEVFAVLQRMSQQYSPLVSMDPQRSDMSDAIHIGPWNDHDFPNMSRMSQPILLLVAELSDIFFKEGAAAAHRLWPNTRLETIAGTDHLLMLEEPEVFNQKVLAFITEADQIIVDRRKASQLNPGYGPAELP